jgi:hypothetical protein
MEKEAMEKKRIAGRPEAETIREAALEWSRRSLTTMSVLLQYFHGPTGARLPTYGVSARSIASSSTVNDYQTFFDFTYRKGSQNSWCLLCDSKRARKVCRTISKEPDYHERGLSFLLKRHFSFQYFRRGPVSTKPGMRMGLFSSSHVRR